MTIEKELQNHEDELDFIIAYENGEIESVEELADGFQKLIDSGIVWRLQGSYSRTALALIENGTCELSDDKE